MKIFKLPDLGEGLPDAEIHEWHVKAGDIIKANDLMVSMETAKAVVEVPAPRSGIIAKLYGKQGDIIKTGSPLVEFQDESEDNAIHPDAGTVAGKVEVGNIILNESPTGIKPVTSANASIKATPAVRVLAQRLGIDLSTVTPTGPQGHIIAADIERAKQGSASTSSGQATVSIENKEGFEPIRGVRRAMVATMALSHAEVVPVTLVDDADLHSWPKDTDITLRVIRAIIAACKAEPALNAWLDSKVPARKVHDKIHLGIAMDSDDGLFVPVLTDIANTAHENLRSTINRYKEQVKSRTIPPDNLRGATIMLSNFGTFAGRYANPIIVPPIVAIIGTGKIRDEVVAHQGNAVVHRILPLSLTIDHRAVTGGEAARFLAALIKDLQE